mmetsp:Transcript_71881/g.159877  ORF Transcript_71881/g.159877 Transcript_71881/m.159877 type:complete len:96 (+) Transcript_71881:224-511(+)
MPKYICLRYFSISIATVTAIVSEAAVLSNQKLRVACWGYNECRRRLQLVPVGRARHSARSLMISSSKVKSDGRRRDLWVDCPLSSFHNLLDEFPN